MLKPSGSRNLYLVLALVASFSSFILAHGAQPLQSAPAATPTATPAGAAPVDVEARIADVSLRSQATVVPLTTGQTRRAGKGDAVNVDDNGVAWLHFPQALLIKVFRNSYILSFSGSSDDAAAPIDRFFLEVGTIFGAPDPSTVATQKMTIETGWATIKELGTQFFVHFDQQYQVTWVVVVDGAVQITADGQTTIVQAGWQTWVVPQHAPEPPIPASRAVIGSRFPTVDYLTNNQMHEPEVLTNQQCTVIAPGLNVRDGPGPGFKIADRLRRDERFEAIRRTSDAAQPTWIYGITTKGVWGWVDSSFVHCGYQVAQLSSAEPPALFIGWPAPPVTPTPISTATPTPTNTDTATPKGNSSAKPATPTATTPATPTATTPATPTVTNPSPVTPPPFPPPN